jgi:helix-turn-helix protein
MPHRRLRARLECPEPSAGSAHKGPITRAFLEVLAALLWGFHNSRDGRCFPSYEAIAARAGCARSTVAEALKVLEWAGVLTWQNRISRAVVRQRDLFGRWSNRGTVIRTSNAYAFRDPQQPLAGGSAAKSENPPGTQDQDVLDPVAASPRKLDSLLERALARFGVAVAIKVRIEQGADG